MRWLQKLCSRLGAWHDRRESQALLRDIDYHKRAEVMHRSAAWKLAMDWCEKKKQYPRSSYAREIQRLKDLNDFEEAERCAEKIREAGAAIKAFYQPPAPFATPGQKQAERLAHNIFYLDLARRARRDRERGFPW
jgi:hypothetical protein